MLLVSFDTTRADALSPYGAPAERTPTLARLAREAAVFETAISPVPLTLPAHATMLTGLDPCRHSVRANSAYALPADAVTLAETLRDAGWRTFATVASIVLLPAFGLDQGFGSYDAQGLSIASEREHERQADAVADAAIAQLAGPEPFFGFVHFYDPHRPYRAPAELERQFGEPYFAEIHLADRALGRLLDALRQDGRLDRTIVVFTADHGESRGEHGESTHGLLLHDATQHVPLIVRGPGVAPRRIGVDVALVTLADLMPTVLELAGVAAPAIAGGFDGRSLAPLLCGGVPPDESESRDAAYLETCYPQDGYDFAPLYGVRTREWKLVLGARPHLWHVADDPRELHDVAAEHPDVVSGLTRRLLALRDGRGDALPVSEHRLTGSELAVFGGLGYVAGAGAAAPASGADAASRLDAYDDVQMVEEMLRASVLAGEGKADQAIALLEPIVQEHPGIAHARASLGALYGKRGDHEKALEELQAAARLRPRSPDAQMQAALAAFLAGKKGLARNLLESATRLPGCPTQAFLMLADLMRRAGDTDAARELLNGLHARADLPPSDRSEVEQALHELGR